MKSKLLFFVGVIFLSSLFSLNVYGKEIEIIEVIPSFRQYKDINNLSIVVPTVVEVPFDNEYFDRFEFGVVEDDGPLFKPSFFNRDIIEIPLTVNINGGALVTEMNDNNTRTYSEFSLPENAQGSAQINIAGDKLITSSSLTVLLDNNVALPRFIEIRAEVNGENKIVVARSEMKSSSIQFPKTTSDKWTFIFTYSQPLRITELRLNQENKTKETQSLRFLAQPGSTYRIYFNPDQRPGDGGAGESGDLRSDKDVLRIAPVVSLNNPLYKKADIDEDGIPDVSDNCVLVANVEQEDVDGNGRGDVCDDFDKDGLINSKDNCPNQPNRYQEDEDGDGIGNVCDGEESRITEKYPWLPWLGVGIAAVILVVLFVITAKSMTVKKEDDVVVEDNSNNLDSN
ncbi:hypothetical protein A2442_03840 [Candidatus Campbellbacteria bacterium RIFOXYC2_FULL_35_25]|uniref:Uncharacterized protein n=1 Tax=Candidatus Campbellbacteria bacterium RIFOXYC2_FULL_35_25 TaxID=1797582 RepID=A0A1F5EKF0_9BACT|nr:MAG: hypothetical protein A2442_03840 [Candidatus Campbellbacteria bacterium RIFOXYC2_FULL_35_25]